MKNALYSTLRTYQFIGDCIPINPINNSGVLNQVLVLLLINRINGFVPPFPDLNVVDRRANDEATTLELPALVLKMDVHKMGIDCGIDGVNLGSSSFLGHPTRGLTLLVPVFVQFSCLEPRLIQLFLSNDIALPNASFVNPFNPPCLSLNHDLPHTATKKISVPVCP